MKWFDFFVKFMVLIAIPVTIPCLLVIFYPDWVMWGVILILTLAFLIAFIEYLREKR